MTEEGRLPQGSGRPAFKCVFESVPSIKQDSARKHSQLGCHLNGSQAQHSWRCSHDLSPRLRKTGHSFCLLEATLQLHLSIECLLMHRAGRHTPPHWKGRAVQAPASGSSLYNTARSQTDQHPTLNQQIPETGFSKEKPKSGVPRGPPSTAQSLCPALTDFLNHTDHLLCPTMPWGKDCGLLTSVTVSCGMVAKLGEEKVKPLSVPAS